MRAGDAVYGTIEAAVTGQDAVINTVGGKTPHKNPTLETMVTTSIITAMQRRGVHRLVVTSLIGIGHSIANATPTS